MASTIALLRRIRTAQNVSKTTKAMQMIAASKLKKAQEAALASRPYVEKLSYVSKHLSKRVDKPSLPAYMKNPSTGSGQNAGKKLIVAISPDKGLCGGLVTNLTREVLVHTTKNDKLVTVGKKIEGPASRMGDQLIAAFPFGNTLPPFSIVYPVVQIINDEFISGKVDSVEIISTRFINMFTQKPETTKLLPLLPEDMEIDESKEKKLSDAFQLFEPNLESILPDLLKRYIEMVIYQEILESYLSEQAARMLAMQNATDNARDIIEDLKLEYNKTRQAKITSEILDITSGASA